MNKDPIISVSGFRGIVGETLHPQNAIDFAAAFVSTLGAGPIVLTRDGRGSGTMLCQAISSAMAACGRDVCYADVAATPTTGVLVRELEAAGGIQVSASHNPLPYNGIKLFAAHGRVISAAAGQQVIELFRKSEPRWVSHEQVGDIQRVDDTTTKHLQLVLATVDVERIRRRNFKVVLDANHGAGSILGRRLLESLGADFQILGDQPDGAFAHPPEPTAENLQAVATLSQSFGADVVFCQDPDADRLAIIDELGNYIGEEYTLAITLQHRLKHTSGTVVVNCASSRMSADLAAAAKSELILSAVGEANVTAHMIESQAVYGGEGNGGPIDPRVGYVRDSFVAMAQVLDALAESGLSISQLVTRIPRYEIHKTKIEIDPTRLSGLFDQITDHFGDVDHCRDDGLRLDWDDAWLLIRASNTEPMIRIIAEAKTLDKAKELCQQVMNLV